jgi:pyruvate,water dikinase
MFTANPLTGLRSETVIDATYGLGEALVSGQVQPDHYVVDTLNHTILKKELGAKALSIRSQAGGGTAPVQEDRSHSQALPDDQILDLVELGQQVAAHYQAPQDIEWAYRDGSLVLLQSRPVTSLFPTPEGMPAEPLSVMFSFAAVQGMLDPLTPLGRDVLFQVAAMASGLFGYQRSAGTQTVFYSAGERLWVNLSTPLRNTVGRTVFYTILPFVEPTIVQALDEVIDDPRLKPGKPGVSLRAMTRIARFALPLMANVMLNLLSPAARRKAIVANGEAVLEEFTARCASIQGERHSRLDRLASVLPELAETRLVPTLVMFISGVATGMASFNLLFQLAHGLPDRRPGASQAGWHDLIMKITRGLPNNPTTEMDLNLWHIAQTIRRDPLTWQAFQSNPPDTLAHLYLQGQLPGLAQTEINKFLKQYGGRGLGEIDAGRPRWAENPHQVFEMLASYLRIDQPDQAPDAIFDQSARSAQQAIDELAAAVRQTRAGWFKARLVKLVARRVRELMSMREAPKFFAVRMFSILRQALLAVGHEFAQDGELDRADDLCFLTLDEMKALAGLEKRDWKELIAQRRALYEREMRRKQIPRVLLNDGRAFYEGLPSRGGDGHHLAGSPVSPGSAQGKVRVVFDPRQAGLLPGEILVCRGTDPSWTPLFLSAGGLVMETGGMMTHGAVVAREYGIPAIVGVDQATARLATGQTIQMDGSTGQIVILAK